MAASTPRSSPESKRSPKLPARKGLSSSKPFLRFYHSAGLRKKTHWLLITLEKAQDPTVHRKALGDLVVELTNSGLDYYFIGPLKLAKPGFIVEQSANIGMAGTKHVMGSVIRNVIGLMNKARLLSVCGSIRQLML